MTQLMYGKQVVKQILAQQGKAKKLYLAVNDPEIEKLAEKAHVAIQRTDRKTLTKMTGSENHQGAAVETDPYKLYSVDEIVKQKKNQYGLIIMLDELEDPHNLGAVLRTADAVQADGVIFKKTHNAGLTPTVAKVSAGAIDTVRCAAVTNLTRTAQQLKKDGYWIIGADMDGQDYRSLKYDFNAVLIIGNEGKGISRLLRQECDYVVSLPMKGRISSLNASVSAGILMYEISSQRFPL
ncbi:MAG: 23S rRNA (guanosine(2251)-2'-O)-methyltransferase RlmB [Solobacterium sp.]|nr:23S rRNA (guanosine(2251)-2'-O)-methyltransferase RlmB [Solobacterium sp.]